MIYDILNEQRFLEKYNGVVLEDFDFENPPPVGPEELSKNLIDTMCEHAGLGMAANQADQPFRVFVTGDPRVPKECSCIFNPIIVDASEEEDVQEEGCITFPLLFLPVSRPIWIKTRITDFNGETITKTFQGLTARIFQHEFDHLNGLTYLDRAKKFHINRAKRKRKIAFRRRKNAK